SVSVSRGYFLQPVATDYNYNPTAGLHTLTHHGSDWLKKLSLQGCINIRSAAGLQELVRESSTIEDVHLRGVAFRSRLDEDTSGNPESWAPFFETCADKESVTTVRFEVLLNLNYYWDTHGQEFRL